MGVSRVYRLYELTPSLTCSLLDWNLREWSFRASYRSDSVKYICVRLKLRSFVASQQQLVLGLPRTLVMRSFPAMLHSVDPCCYWTGDVVGLLLVRAISLVTRGEGSGALRAISCICWLDSSGSWTTNQHVLHGYAFTCQLSKLIIAHLFLFFFLLPWPLNFFMFFVCFLPTGIDLI